MKYMRKMIFMLLLLLPCFVMADGETCKTITITGGIKLYEKCGTGAASYLGGGTTGASYNEENNTLTISNGDLNYLGITNFDDIIVDIISDSVINSFVTENSKVTISGEGTLYLGYTDLAAEFTDSEIIFDGINVVSDVNHRATPSVNSPLAGVILGGTPGSIESLFNAEGSKITLNNADFKINNDYDYGILLSADSILDIKNSKLDIKNSLTGIYALDDGMSGYGSNIPENLSKVIIEGSTVTMSNIDESGVSVVSLTAKDSTLNIVGTEGADSIALTGLGTYKFENTKVIIDKFDNGILVPNETGYAKLSLKGGSFDINTSVNAIALYDYNGNGEFTIDENMVILSGDPTYNYQVCDELDPTDCYTVYSFGKNNGTDNVDSKKVLIKAYENIEILDGNNQTLYVGKLGDLVFKINRTSSEYFEKVLFNGEAIDASMYTIQDGVITIKSDVYSKLDIGTYTVTVKYADGEANVSFTIAKEEVNPYTGDMLGYVIIAGMVLLICSAFIMMKRSWVSE